MASGRGTSAVMASVPALVVLLLLSSSTPATCTDMTEDAMQKAPEVAQGVKETGESWAEWARDKLSDASRGLGLGLDNAKHKEAPPREDQHMAEKTKLQFTNPASAAGHVISEKWDDAKDDAQAKGGGISYELSQGTGKAIGEYEKAKARAEHAFQTAKDAMKENPKERHEASKEKLPHARGDFLNAKDTMKEKPREMFEPSNEKLSHARGDFLKAKDTMKEKPNFLKAKDTMKEKLRERFEASKEKLPHARGDFPKAKDTMKENPRERFEASKEKLPHARGDFPKAKDTMKEKPRERFEASKEKLSQARGDLGAKMHKDVNP